MGWQEDVLARVDMLIQQGQAITVRQARQLESLDQAAFYAWRTRTIAALEQIVGPNHVYTKQFAVRVRSSTSTSSKPIGIAILQSLHDDIQNGYFRQVSDLITAEVFSDFLEMADHLLQNSYKDPAASLCGSVLEDGRRRLVAKTEGITVSKGDDLSSLKEKLYGKRVFNNIVRQQVTSWTSLRNEADHGNFASYNADQVRVMIDGVRIFLAAHF